MSYFNDPRERVILTDSGQGYILEENDRYEEMYKWGAKVLDLCDLPVEEYMKPMTVIGAGGGGEYTGGTVDSSTTYSLRYYLNGNLVKSTRLKEGDPIEDYHVEQEGCEFTGWADSNGQTYSVMPGKNLTLYGQTIVNTYGVNFYIDGEIVSAQTEVKYGTRASNLRFPSSSKTGYDFSGWEPNPTNLIITEDVDFYGTFTPKVYVITWNVSGDTEYISPTSVECDAEIPYPEIEIDGYTFLGWSYSGTTMPARNLTITARFETNEYTLRFVCFENGEPTVVSSTTVKYGARITKPTMRENGYSFSNWTSDEDYTTMPSHDVEYMCNKTPNQYVLYYYVDGVQVSAVTYYYTATINKAPKYVKEGYTSTDWVGEPNTMPYTNVTASCQTTINTYEVTVIDNNGITLGTTTVQHGTPVSSVTSSYNGYSYTGSVQTITSDITLQVTPNMYPINIIMSGVTTTINAPYNDYVLPYVLNYIQTNYQQQLVGHHITTNINENTKVAIGGNSVIASIDPNIYQVNADGTIVSIAYGDTILDKLPPVTLSEGEELEGWYSNGVKITEQTVMGEGNITNVTAVTVMIVREVVVIVDDEVVLTDDYPYGTSLDSIISNIDLGEKGSDNGYTKQWTVNGSNYVQGMTVGNEDLEIECTFTPKIYELRFYKREDNGTDTLISSAYTAYKQIIGPYPTMPDIYVDTVEYEFIWSGSSLTGTEMPSHNVNVYGRYVAKVMASELYYGYCLTGDIDAYKNFMYQDFNYFNTNTMSANTHFVNTTETAPEEFDWDLWDEDENYRSEWIRKYQYSIMLYVPEGRTITSFMESNPVNGVNMLPLQTNYGQVSINGSTYNVYGFTKEQESYVLNDSNNMLQFYLTIS